VKYLIITVLALSLVVPVFAATTTFIPIADSAVFELSPGSNYGGNSTSYWGYYNGGQRTLVEYDLSSIAGDIVVGAELTFYLNQNNTGSAQMQSRKLEATWAEMSVTWTNQPTHDTTGAGLMLDQPWVSGTGAHTLDLTAEALPIIQDWIDTPANNFGMILLKDPESGNVPRCYPRTKEYSGNYSVRLVLDHHADTTPTAFNLLTPTDGTTIPVWDRSDPGNGEVSLTDSKSATKVQPVSRDKATVDVDFTWEASTTAGSGDITYDWECDDDPAFGSPDHTATGLASEAHTENFTVTEDETWYWRVTATEDEYNFETVCDDDFSFDFDWELGVESASLGEIKVNFK
jgi:hypothetical protein